MIDSTTGGIAAGVFVLGFYLGLFLLYALHRWGFLPLRAALRAWREERARVRNLKRDIALEGNALKQLARMVNEPAIWSRFGITTMELRGELPSYIFLDDPACLAGDVMEGIYLTQAARQEETTVRREPATVPQFAPAL